MATALHGAAVRLCAAVLTSAIMIGGATFIDPQIAFAEQCVGRNERVYLDVTDTHHLVKIDSCKAENLVNAYGNVKDAAGLSALLGARWWPVGTASSVFFAWAWNNQAQIRGAAASGQGVEFMETNGIITHARPQ